MFEVIKRSVLAGLIGVLFGIGSFIIMGVGILLGIGLLIGGYTVWGILIAVVAITLGAVMRFTAHNVIGWATERGRYQISSDHGPRRGESRRARRQPDRRPSGYASKRRGRR